MVLTEKQRQVGRDNFRDAVAISRRQFLSGAAVFPTAAAMYWGYSELKGEPVRAGIIGTGDQGNYAHLGQSNPDYIRFVAFSDIRPSSQKRTWATLQSMYGEEARKVTLHEDYKELLAREDIELVIVALPLHLHAQVSIEAMAAGKHVLCEKLMAKTVMECKEMIRAAHSHRKLLAIGHQRHYSYLYANAQSIIEQKDLLGDIRHIRAYWHRNQTGAGHPEGPTGRFDSWSLARPLEPDMGVDFAKYGYSSLEELVRWRIFERTGGGLMVELGSHQLDAASIFLGKVHPKAVSGVGVNSYFQDKREVADHIFLIFEFPNDVVVTYSSICTNAFDGYGEQVMGPKGTLIVHQEAEAYAFKEGTDKETRVKWAEARLERPAVSSGATAAWGGDIGKADTLTSRGYREQQEHLCWLIRQGGYEYALNNNHWPRCRGEIALADAVVALTANLAMKHKKRIEFRDAWFDYEKDDTPEEDVPRMA